MTRVIVVLLTLACAGCVIRGLNVEELPQPRLREAPTPEWRSEFDRNIDKPLIASLGDTMFVVTRYLVRKEQLAIMPPPRRQPLPPADSWSVTHTWGEFIVYTSPNYYNGSVGVVATREGRLPKAPIMLQVAGVKTGQTWPVRALAGDALFVRQKEHLEIWGVRYGGRRGGATEFQIIDRANPSVSQVVQSLSVADRDLRAGVLIKGVLVKVVGEEQHGAVTYSLVDVEQMRRASQALPPEDKKREVQPEKTKI